MVIRLPKVFFLYMFMFSINAVVFLLTIAVMDIDSVGTFTMCYEALKYLKKGGPGRGSSGGGSINFEH